MGGNGDEPFEAYYSRKFRRLLLATVVISAILFVLIFLVL